MKCYLCKKDSIETISILIQARNKREKTNFRDVCNVCYEKTMRGRGLELIDGVWRWKK